MSTFVSIGNSTQSFARLLNEVQRIAPDLPQPIIVQHGRTKFESDTIEHFDFTDEAGFLAHLRACTLFITHGGGGSVFSAIKLGKKAVVVPRRKAFDEIVDDHQMAFAEELARQGNIVPVYDIVELKAAVDVALANPEIPDRGGKEGSAIAKISHAVAQVSPEPNQKICIVTPSGGHLTEARELSPAYAARPHFFVINTPIVQPPEMQGRTIEITLSQRDLNFFVNLWEAFQILRRERPQVILTTGGGFSVAFTLVGKLFSIPTIYIETVAKVNVPTATGRVMYWIADRFFYQWPYLERYFPKGEYIGLVL
jgi:UDP-N-acetylglucosamine transferase subunit ALG13